MSIVTNTDPEANPKTRLLYDLLAEAGYATVRVLSLKPFDKIVGGLAWGITVSNNDIQVQYSDEMKLGEKLRASQKICEALRRMDCPHALGPYQIQGLDIPTIYNVAVWLCAQVQSWRVDNAKTTSRYCIRKRRQLFREPARIQQQGAPLAGKVIHNTIASSIPISSPLRIYSALVQQGDLVAQVTYGKFKKLLLRGYAADTADGQAFTLGQQLFDFSKEENEVDLSQLKQEKKPAAFDRDKIGQFVHSVEQQIERSNLIDSSQSHQLHQLSKRKIQLQVMRQKQKSTKQMIARGELAISQGSAQIESSLVKKQELEKRLDQMESILEEIRADLKQNNIKTNAELERLGKEKLDLKKRKAALKKEFNEKIEKAEGELQEAMQNQPQVEQSSLEKLQSQLREKKKIFDKKYKEFTVVCCQIAINQRRGESFPTLAEVEQYRTRFQQLFQSINRQIEKRRLAYSLIAEYESLNATLKNFQEVFVTFKGNFLNCQKSKSGKKQMVQDLNENVGVLENNLQNSQVPLKKARDNLSASLAGLKAALDQQREGMKLTREVTALAQRLNSQ